ncbi:MAG: retropepsin-like aspartic protease [Elusimicrobiota bacterium]
MSIEFPLKEKLTTLGKVIDPKITVELETKYGYIPVSFILDSGADCSMLPKSMAKAIGIDLKSCPSERSYGIEGKGVKVYISSIKIKIRDITSKVRCFFSENEQTPFILGRIDFFRKFNVNFDNKNKKIILIPIK